MSSSSRLPKNMLPLLLGGSCTSVEDDRVILISTFLSTCDSYGSTIMSNSWFLSSSKIACYLISNCLEAKGEVSGKFAESFRYEVPEGVIYAVNELVLFYPWRGWACISNDCRNPSLEDGRFSNFLKGSTLGFIGLVEPGSKNGES